MSAIFRREIKAFFTNPIGYVVLAVFFCISGFFFFSNNLYSGTVSLSNVFSGLFTVTLLALPFLTMRLFSEEKRQKTDKALLTAPTSLTSIVMGKFLATLVLFIIGISVTVPFAIIIATKALAFDWLVFFGNFLGLVLVGGMIIAIGVLISCLTESQIVAALGTLTTSLLLMCVDLLSSIFSKIPWMVSVTNFLSITTRYSEFTRGVINYDNVIFFLTLQALFIFLTVRVLDRKRWN